MYDVAIIGAGINGSSLAHEFFVAKKSVILFDMEGVASGGSGAAGAFISPKFSKSGELKELLHEAFVYSMDFYEKNFPHLLNKAPLVHIAKDEEDAEILRAYKQTSALKLKEVPREALECLTPHAKEGEKISLDGAIVHAKAMCEALSKNADFVKEKVESLLFDNGAWIINGSYSAKEVILAIGAYEPIIKEPYMQLRGVWGHRIDIRTSTQNPCSVHQFVSISPSKDGILAIGATHNVHYHPQKNSEPFDVRAAQSELLEKASRTLKLENVQIIQDYAGLRSGSFDYLPIIGKLVNSQKTLACKDLVFQTKKPNYHQYTNYPNLYMINGSGGYGFVLAPFLAKILSQAILNAQDITQKLIPARFFARWAKSSARAP